MLYSRNQTVTGPDDAGHTRTVTFITVQDGPLYWNDAPIPVVQDS
ncbi:MAG TPA: hypothetical protein VH253_11845 [Phycisphaerae bacterium]|nr:hypothetical protein [Phycisphaerae bacterium]